MKNLHGMDDMSRTSPLVFNSPSTPLVYHAVSNEVHSFPLLFVSISCIVVCCLSLELTSFLPFSVLLSFHLQPKTGAVTQQTETDGTTNKTKEDTIQNDGEQQNKEAQPKDKPNGAEAVSNHEVHSFPLYFTSVSFHVTHHRPMLSYLKLEVK
jgi:hypothetical protein